MNKYPDLKKSLTKEGIKEYWNELIKLENVFDKDDDAANMYLIKGIIALKNAFGNEKFKEYWPILFKQGKRLEKNA